MWWDGIRDLTKDEETLIQKYLIGQFGKENEEDADYFFKKILADNNLKMDFLDFAQQGIDMSPCGIQQYVLTD